MNKLKFLFLTLLLGGQLLTAQNKTSFGVELKGIPWKEDNFTDWTLFFFFLCWRLGRNPVCKKKSQLFLAWGFIM